jgi:hypothetical protein
MVGVPVIARAPGIVRRRRRGPLYPFIMLRIRVRRAVSPPRPPPLP